VVSDDEIGVVASESATARDACEKLLSLALARPATDNITVAVVRIYAPQEASE